MKKLLVLSLSLGLFAYVQQAFADGSKVVAPGPVISATGQNYAWPNAASATGGGILVQDGNIGFNWTTGIGTSTNSYTVNFLPALPLLTKAQLTALTPATTGQIAMCTNCVQAAVCVSTGILSSQWAVVASTGLGPANMSPCQ